jgi:hypothetical protein
MMANRSYSSEFDDEEKAAHIALLDSPGKKNLILKIIYI